MTRAAADRGTGAYKWFVAGVLGLIHMISVADRYVMVLLTEPVRSSLGLSDTQLGMLQGTGFAILYCALAVPLGAVADATNRRNLIVLGLALWSVATAAAAFADTFAMLLATRVLVGMGEACLIPAGMSLLAAYFTPATLARGTSIFGLGANLGLAFAFLAGGAVLATLQPSGGLSLPGGIRLLPWQAVFLGAGLSALPALVLLAFIKEPPRNHVVAGYAGAMRSGVAYLRANILDYLPFLLVGAMTAVTGYALVSWSSSIFVRIHGLTATEAGGVIGVVGFVAGPLGTIAGGIALDLLRRRAVAGAPLLLMAIGAVFALVLATIVVFAPSRGVAIAGYALFVFESTFIVTSLYVGMQMLTADGFRGIAASFNMMIYTLAGQGLGPIAVGAISDIVGGTHSLAWGVVGVEAVMCAVIVPVALLCRGRFERRAGSIRAAD